MGKIHKKLAAVSLALLLCTGCTKEAADMEGTEVLLHLPAAKEKPVS